MTSGTLRMIEPERGDDHGCTAENFQAGTAFAHPSGRHTFANDRTEPVQFYLVYFLPEGSSPAPIPADPPPGC